MFGHLPCLLKFCSFHSVDYLDYLDSSGNNAYCALFLTLERHQIDAFPIIIYVLFQWFQELLVLNGITHALLTNNRNSFVFKQVITLHTDNNNPQVNYKASLQENNE
jgi:hypothetical protein